MRAQATTGIKKKERLKNQMPPGMDGRNDKPTSINGIEKNPAAPYEWIETLNRVVMSAINTAFRARIEDTIRKISLVDSKPNAIAGTAKIINEAPTKSGPSRFERLLASTDSIRPSRSSAIIYPNGITRYIMMDTRIVRLM